MNVRPIFRKENKMDTKRGFTLIELVVVIAIIAVLMSILMPVLGRVKRDARAILCQANLRQWSAIYTMYADDNQSRLPSWKDAGYVCWPLLLDELWPYHRDTHEMFLCPMARKPEEENLEPGSSQHGGPFTAWSLFNRKNNLRVNCSYGQNIWAQYLSENEVSKSEAGKYWRTVSSKGAGNIPLILDSASWWAHTPKHSAPPPFEDRWTSGSLFSCINRHNGSVNGLFMDWSIRKVDLKELWTLKWHPKFDTRGPWTRAGGAQPSNWPNWMRSLKDH
jgi:prepilin-type N-terminal cleavage/methylation domain-containing protein/prepilin-type processing-associated H-X9-DG protein